MAENGNGEKAKYINLMVEFTAKNRIVTGKHTH